MNRNIQSAVSTSKIKGKHRAKLGLNIDCDTRKWMQQKFHFIRDFDCSEWVR